MATSEGAAEDPTKLAEKEAARKAKRDAAVRGMNRQELLKIVRKTPDTRWWYATETVEDLHATMTQNKTQGRSNRRQEIRAQQAAEKETKRLNATKNYMPRPNAHPWDISTHAEGQLKGPSPLCTTAWH